MPVVSMRSASLGKKIDAPTSTAWPACLPRGLGRSIWNPSRSLASWIVNGEGFSSFAFGNNKRAEKSVSPVTRFDKGRPSSSASAVAVARPAASAITRYCDIVAGACDISTLIGWPRNAPVSASLAIFSRSITTVPVRSVTGALNPSIATLPLSVCNLAVKVKFFPSRIGTVRSSATWPSPLTVSFSSWPPSISLIGLCTESCRKDSRVPSAPALIVKNGLRKSAISILALRATLPTVTAWLRFDRRLMFSMISSASTTSTVGHPG